MHAHDDHVLDTELLEQVMNLLTVVADRVLLRDAVAVRCKSSDKAKFGALAAKVKAGTKGGIVLMADSAKFGQRGFVTVLPLSALTHLVTDAEMDQQATISIQDMGVEVVRV